MYIIGQIEPLVSFQVNEFRMVNAQVSAAVKRAGLCSLAWERRRNKKVGAFYCGRECNDSRKNLGAFK